MTTIRYFPAKGEVRTGAGYLLGYLEPLLSESEWIATISRRITDPHDILYQTYALLMVYGKADCSLN
jgi:hypothetical protein